KIEDRGSRIENCNLQPSALNPRSSILDLLRCSDLAYEFIPHPVNRQDELRPPRIGFQFLPQPGHMNVNSASGRHRVVSPDLIQQLVARERRLAVFDEVSKQLKLLGREFDLGAVAFHFGAAEINSDRVELVGTGMRPWRG